MIDSHISISELVKSDNEIGITPIILSNVDEKQSRRYKSVVEHCATIVHVMYSLQLISCMVELVEMMTRSPADDDDDDDGDGGG